MSYWYVFFVLTGYEKRIENRIMNQLYDEGIVPFIPILETLFKRGGKVKKELNIMFPGYVFVESDLESVKFLQRTHHIVSTSKDIIGILRYGNSDEIAVREDERESFMRLCNNDHCIESSMGFIEGDRFYIEKSKHFLKLEPFRLMMRSEYELHKNMLEIAKEKTVILISHRLSTTKDADIIYYMEHGEVIESGSHSELMKRDERYARMFRVQAESYKL